MIPYAILSGRIEWENLSVDHIRILDLSTGGFSFRLAPNKFSLSKPKHIFLSFFHFSQAEYQSIQLNPQDYTITEKETQEFFSVYQVQTAHPAFLSCSRQLMQEYLEYIDLKLYHEDAELSMKLTGYDPKGEQCFPSCVSSWKKELFHKTQQHYQKRESAQPWRIPDHHPEIAISLGTPLLQKRFLSLDPQNFLHFYWDQQGLSWHPIAKEMFQCVYIGNSNCIHLFPEEQLLLQLLEHSRKHHIKPVILFPPMRQNDLDKFQEIIDFLLQWLKKEETSLEVVVNDWGMAAMLMSFPQHFSITMGILLNRRRKDTRMTFKNGYERQLKSLQKNSSNEDFYGTYLKNHYNIQSYSYESCGYSYQIPMGNHVLHLPFYQMNTAGNCTLYAACKNGIRGRQIYSSDCPRYCETTAFLYPSMLSMVGIQKTLYGYDENILWDTAYFHKLCSTSIHRIVLDFLI